MKKMWLFNFMLVAGFGFGAGGDDLKAGDVGAKHEASGTRMTIITEKGFVAFNVGSDWKIVNAQGKPPVANLSFQLNPAASVVSTGLTNLGVSFISSGDAKAKDALSVIGKKYGDNAVKSSKHKDWQLYTQEAVQEKTNYLILDAKKTVADVIVHVRLAGPKVIKDMNGTLKKVLDSVEGRLGVYTPKPDEVFRRPN